MTFYSVDRLVVSSQYFNCELEAHCFSRDLCHFVVAAYLNALHCSSYLLQISFLIIVVLSFGFKPSSFMRWLFI